MRHPVSGAADHRLALIQRAILLGVIILLSGSLGIVKGQSAGPTERALQDESQVVLPFITGGTGVILPPTPEAIDDIYQTPVDTPLVVDAAGGVLTNDTGSGTLGAVLVDDASHGDLILSTDGSFTYTPAPQFTGEDSFTYRADDDTSQSNIATVRLIVTEGAIPPTASDDAYETPAGTPLVVDAAGGVLANDTGIGPLQAVLAEDVTSGTLALNADGSFGYTPDAGFAGVDSFTYRAVDGTAESEPATVLLVVDAVLPPVATDDAYQAVMDTPLVVDALSGVLANDTTSGPGPLQAVLVEDVTNGTLALNADGSFGYTPEAGFAGVDSFTYRAVDGTAESNVATVTLTLSNTTNDAPVLATGTNWFTKKVIDTKVKQVHTVVGADLDGDNDIDFIATNYLDGLLMWYQNDGHGDFITKVLDPNLDGAYPANIADVDQDGDSDVVAAGYKANVFAWYRNDGSGNFTRTNIDTRTDGPHSIVVVDLDKDGDNDFLTSSQDAGTIAWYENNGAQVFQRRFIDKTAFGAKRAQAADIDGDGDLDIAIASYDNDQIAWLENNGSQTFTKHVIANNRDGAYYATPADIDGDGDIDILTASKLDNTIALYRNDGAEGFVVEILDDQAIGARSVIAVDIDRDGDLDPLSTSREDDTIAWFVNDGTGHFDWRAIDQKADGAYGIQVIDLDDDADLDLLSASRSAGEVSTHTRTRSHEASITAGGTLVIDGELLRATDSDDGPAELTFTITNAPEYGELRLDGAPLADGASFTQEDINNGRLTYVHGGISFESADAFFFTVADGGEDGALPAAGGFQIDVIAPPG
ncbi:MAG: tandem-95 repeat protein [Candidatus Promineofilum sp.]|nr:tandem-95 repeat protein [Promineifilum sp.]